MNISGAETVMVSASSVGLEALGRLNAGPLTVHSAYRGAVNVSTSAGLVSLVTPQTGRGPLNVVVSALPGAESLSVGDDVVVEGGILSVAGRFVVAISGVEVYSPSRIFARPVLSEDRISDNLRVARDVVATRGRFAGLGALLLAPGLGPRGAHLELNAYSMAARPAILRLLGAIRRADVKVVRSASSSLAGLGVGLTPSADDLLSGSMLSMTLGARNGMRFPSARALSAAICRGASGRTSALSLEYMKQAAKGRGNERFTEMVEAVYTKRESQAEDRTSKAVEVGETSGTDTAAGIIFGVEVGLGRRGRAAQ